MSRTLSFSNHVSGRLKFILLRWVESEQKIPNQIPEIDYITLQVQYHILSYQSGNTLALKGNKFHKELKTPPNFMKSLNIIHFSPISIAIHKHFKTNHGNCPIHFNWQRFTGQK